MHIQEKYKDRRSKITALLLRELLMLAKMLTGRKNE